MFDQVRLGYDTVNIARRWLNTEIQNEYKKFKTGSGNTFLRNEPATRFQRQPPSFVYRPDSPVTLPTLPDVD